MKGKKLVLLFILGLFLLISLLGIEFLIELPFVLLALNGFFSAGIGAFVPKLVVNFFLLGWKDIFFLSTYLLMKIMTFIAFIALIRLSIRKLSWLSPYFCSLYTIMLQVSAAVVFFIVPAWIFFRFKFWLIPVLVIGCLSLFTIIVSLLFRNLLVPIHEGENLDL